MPIRKEFRPPYRTQQWFDVRIEVRARDENRCQKCQLKHETWVVRHRDKRGELLPWGSLHSFTEITARDAAALEAQGAKVVQIKLQCCHRVAPSAGGAMFDLSNLWMLCGGCHLAYDKGLHKSSRQTRKDLARPILELIA